MKHKFNDKFYNMVFSYFKAVCNGTLSELRAAIHLHLVCQNSRLLGNNLYLMLLSEVQQYIYLHTFQGNHVSQVSVDTVPSSSKEVHGDIITNKTGFSPHFLGIKLKFGKQDRHTLLFFRVSITSS